MIHCLVSHRGKIRPGTDTWGPWFWAKWGAPHQWICRTGLKNFSGLKGSTLIECVSGAGPDPRHLWSGATVLPSNKSIQALKHTWRELNWFCINIKSKHPISKSFPFQNHSFIIMPGTYLHIHPIEAITIGFLPDHKISSSFMEIFWEHCCSRNVVVVKGA